MNKKLRALIDRAERLIAEREEVAESVRDLRKEIKSAGWDAAQIMKLAQLSHDDKKRAKLAASNEMLAVYNRESGLGLVLGLDESEPGPARAAAPAVSAPRAAPAGSDTPSPAGGASPPADLPPIADALPVAPSVPAGEPDAETDRGSDARPTPEGPAARVTPPSPDPDADWEKRDSAATFFEGHRIAGGKEPRGDVDTAKTLAVIARCEAPAPDAPLELPSFLRVGTEANKAARAGR